MPIEQDLTRIADALEIIAAAKSGNDAPRTETTKTTATAGKTTATKDKATAADKKAADKKAAETVVDDDPLGLGGGKKDEVKPNLTMEIVRDKLAELMEKDGKASVFKLLEDKGGGVKKIVDLKKEFFEDVYNAAVDALA